MIKMDILTSILDRKKKILIMGAHQDDAEFSCGRLISRRKGINTQVIYFTDGRMGNGDVSQEKKLKLVKKRKIESIKAMKKLSLDMQNLIFLGLPDQDLISNPYIIDKLYLLIKKFLPDYVLIPPYEGAHPDHDVTHLFSFIALKNFGFNAVWHDYFFLIIT